MDNNKLRQIVLNELYEIAYETENIITEQSAFSKLPPTVTPTNAPDSVVINKMPGGSKNTSPGGSIVADLEKQSGVTLDPAKRAQQKIAAEKLASAAMRCGWGKDVQGYRKSGWKCKNSESPFRITDDLRTWRTWLQSEMPQEYKKLGHAAIEASETPGDAKMYYKHIDKYAKYRKSMGETTPGVDDENSTSNISPLMWIAIAIAANKVWAGISGVGIVTGIIALIRRRRATRARRQQNRSDKQSKKWANSTIGRFLSMSTHQIGNQIAKNPAKMKAEMQAAAKLSNSELRASIAEVSGKTPSKITNKQLDDFRNVLKDPALTRDAIVSARKMIIDSFMKNKGAFTADEVIAVMTKNERSKYEKYVRSLEKRRKK